MEAVVFLVLIISLKATSSSHLDRDNVLKGCLESISVNCSVKYDLKTYKKCADYEKKTQKCKYQSRIKTSCSGECLRDCNVRYRAEKIPRDCDFRHRVPYSVPVYEIFREHNYRWGQWGFQHNLGPDDCLTSLCNACSNCLGKPVRQFSNKECKKAKKRKKQCDRRSKEEKECVIKQCKATCCRIDVENLTQKKKEKALKKCEKQCPSDTEEFLREKERIALLPTTTTTTPPSTTTLPDTKEIKLSKGLNKLAFDMYKALLPAVGQENFFFSPFSISSAVLMLFAGTPEGSPLFKEVVEAFDVVEMSQLDVCRAYRNTVADVFNASSDDYILVSANRIFSDINAVIKQPYLDHLANYFNNTVEKLPLMTQSEFSRQLINKWVAETTNQMIQELLVPGMIHTGTVMVVINAMVFEAEWKRQFTNSSTRSEPFTTLNGTVIHTPMMSIEDHDRPMTRYYYDEVLKTKFIEMFYVGGTTSMVVALPDNITGLPELEANLTPNNLRDILRNKDMVITPLRLRFPKFQMRHRLSDIAMKNMFTNVNITELLGGKYLTLMSDPPPPLDESGHETFVTVDETGTKAAAATFFIIGVTIGPVLTPFIADHPFLFLIRHVKTETILFMGRMAFPNPGKSMEIGQCQTNNTCDPKDIALKCCGKCNMFQYQNEFGKLALGYPGDLIQQGICWNEDCVRDSHKCNKIVMQGLCKKEKQEPPCPDGYECILNFEKDYFICCK